MSILQQFIIDKMEKKGKTFILLQEAESGELSIKHNTRGEQPDPFWEVGDIEIPIKSEKHWQKLQKLKPKKIEKKLQKMKP